MNLAAGEQQSGDDSGHTDRNRGGRQDIAAGGPGIVVVAREPLLKR